MLSIVPALVLGLPILTPVQGGAGVAGRMGLGFNLGNTFDLKINPTTFGDFKTVLSLYKSAGAKHVRIPVTWMDGFDGDHLADSSGTINTKHPRLKQLRAIVDFALAEGLYVIVNTHHEHWLKKGYNGAEHDKVFRNLWQGIAKEFNNKSPKLIFEILNEPEGVFGQWQGPVTPFDKQALIRTRKIQQIGYDAVRKTGGNNTNRIVMLTTNGQGNHSVLSAVYPDAASLPGRGTDRNIIFTVHTYDPWGFCGQTGKNAAWPGADSIAKSISPAIAHATKLGIGIHFGEFGVGRETTQGDRNSVAVRDYYRTVWSTVNRAGGSACPWDDRGWFGLIERNAASGKYQFKFNLFPSMQTR